MTNKEYREHEGISKSVLFKLTKSPKHFKYHLEHPEEDTTALRLGRATHKYILEKDDFFNEVAIAPNCDRRTKEGKEIYAKFVSESAGKDVISEDEFKQIKEMAAVLEKNKYAKALLQGEHEQSYFWVDEKTGETCKCRPDCLTEIGGQKVIVDYKTTSDPELSAFMRSALKYGYDLQAGMYSEGMKKITGNDYTFVFIAQESKPPYDFNVVQADEYFMAEGNKLFHDLMEIYHECKTTDNWWGVMGREGEIGSLTLPEWLKREVSLNDDDTDISEFTEGE